MGELNFTPGCCCCTPGCKICSDNIPVYELDLQYTTAGAQADDNNPFYNGTLPCDTVTFPGCDINPFETCTPNPPTYPEGVCCDQLNHTAPLSIGCNLNYFTTPDEYGNYKDGWDLIELFESGDCTSPEGVGWTCCRQAIISPRMEDGTLVGFGAWWNLNFGFVKLYADAGDPDGWVLGAVIVLGNMYDGNAYYQIIDYDGKKIECENLSIEFSDLQPAYDPGTPYGMFGYCSLESVTIDRV